MPDAVVKKKQSGPSEDVWAVATGSFLILSVLAVAFIWPAYKFTTPVYVWDNWASLLAKVLTLNNLLLLAGIGLALMLLAATAVHFSGRSVRGFVLGFAVIYALAILSFLLAGNKTINSYGIEYVTFALVFGLLLNNLFSLPAWLKSAARSEAFIKTGLVILGSSVLFTDIIKAGLPGLYRR